MQATIRVIGLARCCDILMIHLVTTRATLIRIAVGFWERRPCRWGSETVAAACVEKSLLREPGRQ